MGEGKVCVGHRGHHDEALGCILRGFVVKEKEMGHVQCTCHHRVAMFTINKKTWRALRTCGGKQERKVCE
ncbi:uncharacterized protein G2W53_000297 [Senna tora]|uniref:Uncharacterized protein n=1 Tax=Senna tora TaxID=362788 RepID=A0A835CLG8_9FABA|nr:uncharacterized protein G2W53_000297 [Senna tora]